MTNASIEKKPVMPGLKAPMKLRSGDLKRADFTRPDYRVVVEELKTDRKDILKPEYWANVGTILKGDGRHPFARVELIWADGSRFMEILVMSSERLWAKVEELSYHEFGPQKEVVEKIFRAPDPTIEAADEAQEEESSEKDGDEDGDLEAHPDYRVQYVPVMSWCVFRKSDKERIAEKIDSKVEAYKWMHQYAKGMS